MVEWKKLGEVCAFNRGRTITAKDAVDGDIPVIAGGQTPSYYHNESNREGESITVAGSGAYAGFVSYWNKPIFVSDAFTVDPSQSIKHKYLFQWLKMNQNRIFETQKGAGVPHVHGKDIANFPIPIPSLEEQARIVGILDTFTSAIDNLKEQIAQRRKQYEYYRDQLLDLEGKPGVEMKKVAYFVKERILANELTAQNYTSVENLLKDKAGRKEAENFPSEGNWIRYQKGDVLIGNIRPYLRKIWLSDREGGTNGDVIVIRPNDTLLPEFMFYCLASDSFFLYYNQALKDGKMPRGEKKRVLSYVIPSVGKEEQQRIVSILDTFEASIQNLEAQLEQREKQYEYYRNKLLTFERENEKVS